MGEFAIYRGERIKIGTCEDLYYLRADQISSVHATSGSVEPASAEDQRVLRFRFPWPDEDGTKPGDFQDFGRAVGLHGVTFPVVVEHHSIQFSAPAGYLVSLPCPEGPAATHGLTIHRNGFAGAVKIVQQGYRHGHLALICQCGGCGSRYNLPTLEAAEPIIVACRSEADRHGPNAPGRDRDERKAAWWHAVADRIAAGYQPVEAVAR